MAIILKNSWNVPPARWGSFEDVQYAILKNCETVYNIDPDSIVLAVPLFWGIYSDLSRFKNIITNYGAIRIKEGGFYFDGSTYMWIDQNPSLEFGTGDFSLSYRFKTKSSDVLSILSYGDRHDSAGWTSYIGANGVTKFIIDDSLNQVITEDAVNHANGIKHNYLISINKSNNQTIYLDGVNTASDNVSAVGDMDTNDHDDIQIGRVWHSAGYLYYYIGALYTICINNIALTENQAKLFDTLPYALYQKVARPFYLLPIVVTTAPPTTIVPTSLAPTSLPPTTSAPTTAVPTTAVPTSLLPTTVAPTTSVPTSAAPTTLGPTSAGPTTAAPTTTTPSTPAPTTTAPTTIAPTTSVPTTVGPTTLAPTTLAPTTLAPTSLAPTTVAPTTSVPTTLAPTSLVPTSIAPTTLAPTTIAPTSLVPTTFLTTLVPTTNIPELICVKEIESTITNEFIAKSFIANQLLLESPITKELRIHGNLC